MKLSLQISAFEMILNIALTLQGVMGSSSLQIHQVFEKFSSHNPVDDIDRRFEHFKARLWPRIRDSGSSGFGPV